MGNNRALRCRPRRSGSTSRLRSAVSGASAYTTVDWALAVDSLPALGAAGKDLGVWSIASDLPAVLAPLAGSLVIGGGTALGMSTEAAYRSVFALAGGFLMLGALFA
jgi:hypothetical protein